VVARDRERGIVVVFGEERGSFLKKRTKKLLKLGLRLSGSARTGTKVFWFFFSKKNRFLIT
jgi:hypothetical protein